VRTATFVFSFGLGVEQALAVSQCGKATWYDLPGKTASGEYTSPAAMVAAHRSLPFGTKVRVDNLANGRTVIVRINDRGPIQSDRIIDLSRGAAEQIGLIEVGIAPVRLTAITSGSVPLARPCRDLGPTLSTALPLPRVRPPQAAHEIVPDRAGSAMAARFAFAFQDDDTVQSGVVTNVWQALRVPADPQ
jgi:rare lipoprotein A